MDGSLPTIFARYEALFEKPTSIFVRTLDDVVVRDDVPRLVEHEARPERLLAGLENGVPKNGSGCCVDFPVETIWTTPGALRL